MAEKKITEAAVLSLFREDKITVSRGAELLDIPLQDFMDVLHANGLTLWDDTPEEMEEDLKTLRRLKKSTKRRCDKRVSWTTVRSRAGRLARFLNDLADRSTSQRLEFKREEDARK